MPELKSDLRRGPPPHIISGPKPEASRSPEKQQRREPRWRLPVSLGGQMAARLAGGATRAAWSSGEAGLSQKPRLPARKVTLEA